MLAQYFTTVTTRDLVVEIMGGKWGLLERKLVPGGERFTEVCLHWELITIRQPLWMVALACLAVSGAVLAAVGLLARRRRRRAALAESGV